MGKMNGEAMKNIWTDMVGKYAASAMKCGLWLTVRLAKLTQPILQTRLHNVVDKQPAYVRGEEAKKQSEADAAQSAVITDQVIGRFSKEPIIEDDGTHIGSFYRQRAAYENVAIPNLPQQVERLNSLFNEGKVLADDIDSLFASGLDPWVIEHSDVYQKATGTYADMCETYLGKSGVMIQDWLESIRYAKIAQTKNQPEAVSQEHSAASQDFSSAKVVKPKKTKTKKPTKTASKKKTTTKKSSKTTKAKKSKGTKKR